MRIEVQSISKRFGDFRALDDVALEVPEGSLTALLGPSGSGKSTLLRIVAGLEAPDSGVVLIDGSDVTSARPQERGIGFVFQHYAAFTHMTVRENIAFGLRIRKRPRAEVRERVDELLSLVGLTTWAEQRPAQLSGGQRQRMALARALAVAPRVLLLDEPFGALDANVRAELRRWLRRLHDEQGVTTVLVTHDQEEALVMSDRVAVMSEGRVVQIGSPAEIYEHPRTAFVANFIGDANVFTGTVRAIDGGIATIAQADGSEWQVPVRSAAVGGTVQIAVRPERHDLVAHPSHPSSPVNTLSGTIREIIFLGETLHVLVTLRDGAIARVALRNAGVLTTPLHWCAGDLVRVTWAPKDAQVLEP